MAVHIPIIGFLFKTRIYGSQPRFKVPEEGLNLVGLRDEDHVEISIKKLGESHKEIFRGIKTLKSGGEIYGSDIGATVSPGEEVLVWVWKPN